jgi:methionyl-tRNA synthetase
MSDKTFYVTTPIYYVNARPHIGHAYTTIVADVLARRHRLLGEDTFFLTGTDEHGQKIERSAAAANIPPQQFADQVSKSFEDLWHRMGITNNDYIRTTSPKHKQGVQHLFAELYKRGFIYLASYTGAYCVSDEAFVDAPIGTPCPDCGRLLEEVTEENFFFKLSAFQLPLLDLIESNTIAITPDTRKNEVLSFLRGNVAGVATGIYDQAVKDKVDKPDFSKIAEKEGSLKKTASGQNYVPGALKDLSISRSSFTWGIPVPEPAASTAAQKHVIYVWLDALANYMTALGYGSDDETLFQKFWPADRHLVGKEIIRFHCVYWPAFLLAAGLPLPKAITAHGWLLFDDSKMSKSKGNIVRTETILDAFGNEVYGKQFPDSTKADRDLFASDVLRYFLLREIPFGQDGSFSFDALITRYNADLANGYGNLVSRTLSMIDKYFASAVPECLETQAGTFYIEPRKESFLRPEQHETLGATEGQILGWSLIRISEKVDDLIASNSFDQALAAIASGITHVDQFITSRKPWAATETEISQEGRRSTLYTAAESIRIITALLYPILPYATAKVWAQLGLGDIELAPREGQLNNLEWGGLKPGTKLGPLGPIFPRADKGLAQIMTDMESPTPADTSNTDPAAVTPPPTTAPDAAPRTTTLPEPTDALPVGGSTALTTGPAPATAPLTTENGELTTPQITIDDFAKIELRVAQIVVAERIPKADKLLRLEVDLGPDFPRRQILSGIAEWYTPEELIGRRIVVITNLAPRKMRGLESHGMLLAASHGENGKPVLATFGEDIALGSRLK